MRLAEERGFHMRKLAALFGALALTMVLASPARTIVINPLVLDRPDAKGDQVIFYYDARADFTTFLNLHNEGSSDLDVEVQFYGPALSSPFSRTFSIDAGASRIIDVGALKSAEPALPEQVGVAIATAVDNHDRPVVSRALSGNFTVANLQVHSAWGAPAAARSATSNAEMVTTSGSALSGVPAIGTRIDGSTVLLSVIQPTNAHLALYYDPTTLASASIGGNQLIFVTFEDVPGETYSAQVGVTTWSVAATRSTGSAIDSIPSFVASGVTLTDLVSVAGTGVNGSSGSISFNTTPTGAAVTRLVFFTETLGTFATGYLLPPTVSELL